MELSMPGPGSFARLLLCACLMGHFIPVQADVIKSPSDERDYKALRLANGLNVLVISDARADRAAASMDVYVGSGSEPADRQGLAHFLEHMLFLGTEKYPQPGAYQKFISERGGHHNAFTAFDHTNYFFDVDKAYLEPALDRFAQFFIAPLFSPGYVEREKNAVDSEYRARLETDGRRVMDAQKQLFNPDHPYARFHIGSLETLADRKDDRVRDDLVAFYRKHYTAESMALVVLGRESVDTLAGWVREKFAAVPDGEAVPLHRDAPLFSAGRLPARVDVVPVKDERELELTFPIPPAIGHYRAKPVEYIASLLGHEGEGSVLSLLRRLGWAENLRAGGGINNRHEATFEVSIGLTESGLEHVETIVGYVFQYLRMIEARGVARWRYEEMGRLADIDFRFQPKSDPTQYAVALARGLQLYPSEDVLRARYRMDAYDPDLIHGYLRQLVPGNVLVTVVAKGLRTDAKSPWFDAPYAVRTIGAATLEDWTTAPAAAALALPEPNEFIPEKLALKSAQGVAPRPERILRRPGLEVWFKQDDTFGLPRADVFLSVRSRRANDTPAHRVLTDLYIKVVEDQVREFGYPARVAGLDYSLYGHGRGFSVRISGYDDKEPLLLARIAEALRAPKVSDERFQDFKDEITRALRNRKRDNPYRQVLSEIPDLLLQPRWSAEEQLEALEPLTSTELRAFIPELLARVRIVALCHGNLHREDAERMMQSVAAALLDPAGGGEVPGGEVVSLPAGSSYVRVLEVDNADSALSVYFQGSERSDTSRAHMALLDQVLAAPFYSQLRTEQQLGYVVFSRPLPLLDVPAIAFTVQSPVAGPRALERHVEAFLRSQESKIAALTEADFERHKQSVLSQLLKADENLEDRTARYWNDIDRERYRFDTRERLAEAVRAMRHADFSRLYRATLLGSERRRLVIRAQGTGVYPAAAGEGVVARDGQAEVRIDDPQSFKEGNRRFEWLQSRPSAVPQGGL